METWKTNLDETKKRYIDWWNHKGIILNMWEHFQEGVKPHADIPAPSPAKDLNQKWFDPQWRAEYLDWYVAHSSLKADILPVANTQLGPGSLAAILGGVFEGGEDTIWIHPDPDFNDEIVFNPEHPNWILHKELLKACKAKANGHYYVGMPDLMEGLDVLAALKGTDKVLLDTVMQPEVLEQQMQQINDIYFKVFDELYDIIREGDEMAFCYFSSWAPGNHPEDKLCWHIDDEYYFGNDFLVAPVMNSENRRDVYLPEGKWVNFFTGERLEGGRWLKNLDVPLDEMPVYVRQGATIPVYPDEVECTDDMDLSKSIGLHIDPHFKGIFKN